MPFRQLYYTSCETGLAGYGGYQFNAATPGVSPVIMREVEDRTVYQPPRSLSADSADVDAYPVAFSHSVSEETGAAITAHVVYAGDDYSGRPGNYFAHALVTDTPGEDFGSLLPVELWGAALWQRTPVDQPSLPELPGPPPRGIIDRPGVQAFLDARRAERLLPALLAAIGRAMAGDRPVLLAGQDTDENIWWLAAISYLLGDRLGPRVTFTTYTHRPGYCRYHVIGVPAEELPPDADSGFQLIDLRLLDGANVPSGDNHPLATLLARVGVMSAAGVWQQASAFASGSEDGFDDWLAPVAAAAALLGGPLAPDEADALVRWLPAAADWLPTQHADVVLGVVLGQPAHVRALTDDRLRDLLELTRRLGLQNRVEQLEGLAVERAFVGIAQGRPAIPVRLTRVGHRGGSNPVQPDTAGAAPETALAVLEWAAASGVDLPDVELEHYGQVVLDPGVPGSVLVSILTGRPAVLRGLIKRLAREPAEVAEALFGGPAGRLIGRPDLAQFPGLTELWLLQSARDARMDRMQAFDAIIDVPAGAGRSPRFDGGLLNRLWPSGCPADQLVELLNVVTEAPAPDVLDWFAAKIDAASRDSSADGWLKLVQALDGHPIRPLLPDKVGRAIRVVVGVAAVLRRARDGVPKGDMDVFDGLYDAYVRADDDARRVLIREVPPLLAKAHPLGQALRGCPGHLFAAFCNLLTQRLSPLRRDAELAARVFIALRHPELRANHAEKLESAFGRVREWRRRDLNAIARALASEKDAAKHFERWRDEHRGGRVRKLFGGGGGWPGKGTGRA